MFENFVVMSICNNVYNVKGSNLDLRGADDGSKLLQCYDPAVCTTNYALHNFIWLWNNKTCNIFRRFKYVDYDISLLKPCVDLRQNDVFLQTTNSGNKYAKIELSQMQF